VNRLQLAKRSKKRADLRKITRRLISNWAFCSTTANSIAKQSSSSGFSVALRPLDPRAYDYLGLNLEALGETQKAATIYKKGLVVNKGPLFDYFLAYNYGRFLLKERKVQESNVHLDRAVSLAPETRAVYYERAKLNVILGDYQQARRDAEQASHLQDPSGFVLASRCITSWRTSTRIWASTSLLVSTRNSARLVRFQFRIARRLVSRPSPGVRVFELRQRDRA